MAEGAEMWATLLADWKKRFGFDRIVYVDIANETPYFFPGLLAQLKKATGAGFDEHPVFSAEQISFLANEINKALGLLRREFPELRFTTSIHGDLRWLDVPMELDCLDVHFYADADPRWTERTRFNEFVEDGIFEKDRWFKEFSERSTKTAASMAPMLRARQRFKMSEFANWATRRGEPLTTSEAWATWYYIDDPRLIGPGCWIGRSGRAMTRLLASSGVGLRIITRNRSLQTGRTCNGIARSTNAF
jgi:hypothetical protein